MATTQRTSPARAQILLGLAIPVAPAVLVAGGLPADQIWSLMCCGLLMVGLGMIVRSVRLASHLLRITSPASATETPEALRTALIRAFGSFLFTLWVLFLSALFGVLINRQSFAWLSG